MSFTRLINLALSGPTVLSTLIDDIIITLEDHIYCLGLIFDRIRAAGLKLKQTKCQLLRNEVTFLGHVVSPKSIRTNPEKIKAVQTWLMPLNVQELQTFLSLATYYRRFILGVSIIAELLYKLYMKDVPFC